MYIFVHQNRPILGKYYIFAQNLYNYVYHKEDKQYRV